MSWGIVQFKSLSPEMVSGDGGWYSSGIALGVRQPRHSPGFFAAAIRTIRISSVPTVPDRTNSFPDKEMSTAVSDSYEVHPKRSPESLVLAKARRAVAVEINDLLQVQIPDEPGFLSFKSRVDDIIQDRIQIAWPTDGGILIPIHRNQTLTMSFVRDDAIYTFSGIVEEMKRRPLAQLSVATVGPPERIQRRQFFRVKSVQPVELFGELPNYEDERQPPKVVAIKTMTFEISGSGLSIRHSSTIPPGTLLDAKLFLASEEAMMKILCKVVHSSRISQSNEAALYHIGMFFLSIKEADRTRIVRHVFRVEVR